MSWRSWFERTGVDTSAAARGTQFTDSIVLTARRVRAFVDWALQEAREESRG